MDHNILDFLVYDALKALLSKPVAPDDQEEHEEKILRQLSLVDDFHRIWKTKQPKSLVINSTGKLRLRLLQFTTLFTHRHTRHDVHRWRRKLERRRKISLGFVDLFSPSIEETLTNLPEPGFDTDGSRKPVSHRWEHPKMSLISLLGLFMAVTAFSELRSGSDNRITEMWMRLAAGFMANAVIEQYLDIDPTQGYKRRDKGSLAKTKWIAMEAFAYGFSAEVATTEEEGSDAWQVNAMFFDEDTGGEYREWTDIRQEHLNALIPLGGEDLIDHFTKLREEHFKVEEFEQRMLGFIEGLAQSLPRPLFSSKEWKEAVSRTDLHMWE